jgi:2-polyprenyl-3-methyl-5-hydroxy-6-metoxy-1,4-benzoquinol methylase
VSGPAEARAERIAELGYDYEGREKEVVGECNLCGSARFAETARRDRYGYPATFQVCAECGLGFISPRMTGEEYAAFYADVYRPLVSAYHGRLIDASTVQEEQRAYAGELVSFLRGAMPAVPGDVIDVGGSTGIVAGALVEAFGSGATVLDPAPAELEVAAAAGMETVAGFAEDYDPEGRNWDLVLLCQTIDHLLDVSSTLAAMRGMLGADGHAFVDVLDFEFAMRRRGIEGAVKIDHPYYLTRQTAVAYFTKSAFEVVAERLADDGHWGFLLRPSSPANLDGKLLRANANRLLELIWSRRAAAEA